MLPAPHPIIARPRALALALVLLVFGLAGPAGALELQLAPPRENGGYVWTDVRLRDLFPPQIEQSLSRGMPATLALHTELWRHRNGWFDRLESSFDASIKIRYDVWSEKFLIERRGIPTIQRATLDSVRTELARTLSLPTGRVGALEADKRYYVVVSVALKPLSVEDIEEGEGWLSGEVETKRRSGFGIITGLPRSVFDAVRNFAGFGDQRARAVSDEFGLADLFAQGVGG
jgi:hypothetical protein